MLQVLLEGREVCLDVNAVGLMWVLQVLLEGREVCLDVNAVGLMWGV